MGCCWDDHRVDLGQKCFRSIEKHCRVHDDDSRDDSGRVDTPGYTSEEQVKHGLLTRLAGVGAHLGGVTGGCCSTQNHIGRHCSKQDATPV